MYTIIGAGIGGLATALALEKAGVDYVVYERSPEIRAVGAGIWLAPNALQALDWLGILPAVKDNGWSITKILLGEQDGTPITTVDLEPFRRQFGNSTVAIHRAKLQAAMLAELPADKVQLGKACLRYETHDGGVTAHFSDGSSMESDFLIGADGIRSAVRNQLFPESVIRYTGQTCWRGIAELELLPEHESTGTELWGKEVRFGFSTVAKGKTYWFAVAIRPEGEKDTVADLRPQLRQMFTRFHPVVDSIIATTPPESIIRSDLHDLKPVEYWHRDRVCLIGDAGHATTPNMGQGGAQAIEDAFYLGKLLVQKGQETSVFPRFQQLREKKVKGVVQQSWMIGQMAHWKYGRGLRNLLLRLTPDSIAKRQMERLYTIGSGLN